VTAHLTEPLFALPERHPLAAGLERVFPGASPSQLAEAGALADAYAARLIEQHFRPVRELKARRPAGYRRPR
jgi:hypothetical protein